MGELSAEQALNSILGTLKVIESMIQQQATAKEKEKKGDTDDKVKNLISGLIDTKDVKSADSVGKSFEKLAKGLDALSKVDVAALESVSKVMVNIDNVMQSFKQLASINMDDVIDNIKKLDKKIITKLVNFIKTLNEELKNINNSKELSETVNNISKIFNGINSIISTSLMKVNLALSWWRAKMLAWTISSFVKNIANALDKKKIDESIKYIGAVLEPLTKLADTRNQYSVAHLKKILNKQLATELASFFIELSKQLSNNIDYQQLNTNMDSIYKFFMAFSSKDFNPRELSKKLKPEYAESIVSFFVILADGLSKINSKKFKENAETMQLVMLTFSSHLLKIGWTIFFASMLLSEKRAVSINKTMHALIAGDFDKKKVQTVSEFMREFGSLLLVFSGVLISIVLLVTLAPIMSVIAGVLLVKFGVNFIKNLIIELAEKLHKKDVKAASDMIKSLSFLIIAITSMVAMIAIITTLFGFGAVLGGVVIVGLVLTASYFFIKKLSDKTFMTGAKDSMQTVKSLSLLILALTAAVGVLAFVSSQVSFGDMLIAVVTLTLVMAGMVGIVWLMSKIKKNVQDSAINALKSLTWIMLGVGLISAFILPMITKNIGAAIVGAIFVAVLIALMIGAVMWLSTIKEKNLQKATTSLAILTGILLAVSLIALFILPSLSNKIVETFGGIFVVSIIIALMIGAVMWLSTIKTTNLIKAVSTVAILTGILLAVSLIALFILPELTKNWDKILLGAGIVAIIIAAMIGGVMWLSTIKTTNLIKAAATLAIMVGILLGVSLIANYILPSIGKKWDDALIGGIVTLAIVAGMISLVKLMKKWLPNKILWQALVTLVGMGVILLGVSWITTEYLIPIGAQGAKAIWGAAQIALIIIGMIKIMQWVGKLVKKYAADVAIGAVTVIALAGVLWAVAKLMDPFVDICLKIDSAPDGSIAKSSGIILLILTATGLILGALGALLFGSGGVVALLLAAGAAAVLGIAAIIAVVSEVMDSYVDTVNILKPITAQTIKDTNDKGAAVLTGIAEMLENIPLSLLGDLALLPFKLAADTLFSILIPAATKIMFMNALITLEDITAFNDLMWRAENDNSLIGSLSKIIKKLQEFGVTGMMKIRFIAWNIRYILDTISQFVDVIMKLATGNYIIAYDNNGRPVYQHVKPDDFTLAATNVSQSFMNFLTTLKDGFDAAYLYTIPLLALISWTIDPVIDTVGKFVDVVMKVATGTYITGYDENGKPKFEHLKAIEFGEAGTKVSDSFAYFLKKLNEGFENLSEQSTYSMKLMSLHLRPVIDAVGKFVDVVMKVATGTYVIGYDDNGKEIYEHISASEFGEAGKQVSDQFSYFIKALKEGFSAMSEDTIDAIRILSKSMKPIMESVSMFTDAIVKAVTTQIVIGYDDKDHPIYEQIDIDVFDKAGTSIATNFATFITTLCDNVKKLDYVKQDALEVMSETMSPIMDGVSKFVDAIIKFAGGQYIDYYQQDKDGNYTVPHFTKISIEDMKKAGDELAKCFGTFISELASNFNQDSGNWWDFSTSSTEDVLEALANTLQPIMDSVGSYVNAIMMVATGQVIDGYEKDSKGNLIPKYKHIELTDFSNAADKVAELFGTFIDKLVTKFSDKNFKDKAAKISDIINDGISPIMESFKNFSEALMPFMGIKTGDKDNEVLLVMQPGKDPNKSRIQEIGEDIANSYTQFVGIISDWLTGKETSLNNIKSNAEKVNELVDVVKKTTKSLAEINKAFSSSNNEEDNIQTQMTTAAGTFMALINKYNNFFRGAAEDSFVYDENAITNAKQCLEFLKVVYNISIQFKKLIQNINNENAEQLVNGFNGVLTNIATNMNSINTQAGDINNQNIIDMLTAYHQTTVMFKHSDDVLKTVNYDYVNQYINTLLSLIDNLKTITIEVQKQDLTAGVNEFIGVMNKLTEIKMNRGSVFGASSILMYAQDLNTFTVQINETSKKLTVYIKTLEKATIALKLLDNQIVNKAKQREEALQRFIDKIDGITEAFGRMTTKFDEFDQNALAQRFDAFRDILGAAGIEIEDAKTDNEGKPIENNTNNYYDTFNGRQRKGTITVQFANKILDGTYTTT